MRDFKKLKVWEKAHSSAIELEYLNFLSYDLSNLNSETYSVINNKINEVKKMLSGYAKKMSETTVH